VSDVKSVSIGGGPIPYREALAARLAARGWRVVADPPVEDAADGADVAVIEPIDGSTVVVHYCDSEEAWAAVSAAVDAGALGVVAVILTLDPALYRRAIAMGVGVVHHDTSTEIMAQVIESAGHGEALLPMHVARHLAREAGTSDAAESMVLNDLEIELLRGVVDGETIVALAERFHFSERTIRRRLQSAYLKLGVDDRTAAIRAIERDGLFD
jgi:DNA-binding NarL/FixJ family response regulator